jgi:hypothetical protein
MDRVLLEATLRDFFAGHAEGIVAVYLFGSQARDTAGPRSDVDLGILYTVPPPRTLEALPLDLEVEVERVLRMPVEIVVLNSAPPDLVHRVLRDGRLIAEHDRSHRIRFEVKARNEFFDLQPLLARYRAARPAPR